MTNPNKFSFSDHFDQERKKTEFEERRQDFYDLIGDMFICLDEIPEEIMLDIETSRYDWDVIDRHIEKMLSISIEPGSMSEKMRFHKGRPYSIHELPHKEESWGGVLSSFFFLVVLGVAAIAGIAWLIEVIDKDQLEEDLYGLFIVGTIVGFLSLPVIVGGLVLRILK